MTFWNAALSFPKRRPVLFGLGFSCAKTSFADFLVQRYVEKREEIDLKRNFTFGLFGLGYLGGVQYALYVPVFGRLFPGAASFAAKPLAEKLKDGAGVRNVFAQVFLDQAVHHPLCYFPAFYATRELVEHGPSMASLQSALGKWRENLSEDMVALWKVWVPVMLANFAFSPMWLRIPVVASTSLAWTCILSAMRGAGSSELTLVQGPPEPAFDLYGNQGRALGKLTGRRAVLDEGKAHIVLTAAGDLRRGSGLLQQLSAVILAGSGNVVESRAMQLGSDLTLMMLVEVEHGASAALHMALAEHQRSLQDVHLIIRKTDTAAARGAQRKGEVKTASRFQVAALDRPGLVHVVTKFFSDHGLEVVDLTCEQREDEAMRRLFFMEGVLMGPAQTRALAAGLKKLKGALMAHRLLPRIPSTHASRSGWDHCDN